MIGVLGGTFDPVHHGHLRAALELLEGLPLDEVRFLPAREPPHRGVPAAAPEARRRMVEAAIAGQRGFALDDRELRRDGPSYMVDTLASLRAEVGATPLCLLLGGDAFAGLERWHRWREIPELAHLVVMQRPGQPLPAAADTWWADRRTERADALRARPAGGVLFWAVTQLDISASRVRSEAAAGRSIRWLVPEAVRAMIESGGWYRHDEAAGTAPASGRT